jgi:DNA-directed RNA polymerase subunit N (RpoN/RPB10)
VDVIWPENLKLDVFKNNNLDRILKMIIPMVCFTCGNPLANKWEYYCKRVKELQKEQATSTPGEAASSSKKTYPNLDPVHTREVLDELELEDMCCRRHMLGHVDLIEII